MGKKKVNKKTNKKLLIIAIIAFFITVICIIEMFNLILGSYSGLGLSQSLAENEYDMSNLYRENNLRKYSDDQYESISGIDVSVYQKDIDWEKVKASGIDFAMIRLGYRTSKTGKILMDENYKKNLAGAKAAGVDVGVYFFSQAVSADEAVEEARYVIRHIRGRGIEYPVAFDMEPVSESGRTDDTSVEEKTAAADAFCTIIEKNGYSSMIYGNQTWLTNEIDLTYLTRYNTWLAHYSKSTDYPYEFAMWQYTQKGKVNGIKGNVDINIYFVKK